MTLAWNDDDYLRDDCERDAEAEQYSEELITCPFCGGSGDADWFESHDTHGPSPFDDDDDIKAYWAGRSVLFV